MTKPFMGVSASGCHTNMSLWKGGKVKVNKLGHKTLPGVDGVFSYVEGGTNTFMPDTKDMQLPGKIGLQSIAGIMKHLPALTAVNAGKCFMIPAIDCKPILPGNCISLVSGMKVFVPPST